jgi:flagellar protein FlaJ
MKFKIPFTISDIEILKRKSKSLIKFTSPEKTKLSEYLHDSGEDIGRRQYLTICYRAFYLNFFFFLIIFTPLLFFLNADYFYFYGSGGALLISGFILMSQLNYPRIFSLRKARAVEKYLIPVLQDMMVQLNSGVPIFKILVNISESDYGEVSREFKQIVKEINSGTPQIDAIEKYGKRSASKYFQRVLWQLSNGLRAGSDISIVIREGIRTLSDEQAIQIQSYGSKLNPLIMFYMLIAVILPSLGVTFLIIISSILNIQEDVMRLIFFSIFGIVMFLQFMFLGLIKSKRPSLL